MVNCKNIFISKLAKVVSDKPAYKEKVKTDNGYVWVYDDSHVEKRWKEKKNKLKNLKKNIEKLRKAYEKDLSSDNLRTRALAAIVGIIDDTAMRVGNEDSAREAKTYGATTLKVKHLTVSGGKATFKFVGKDNVKQNVFTKNKKIISVLKELIKGKKDNDFIFEIDGDKIWDRAVNRYLAPFKISAKDIRGFQANRLMEEVLKKKDWKEALDEVAGIVGHKPSTLKNQYLDPDLVHKYDKKKVAFFISKRAMLSEKEKSFFDRLKDKLQSARMLSVNENKSGIKTNELIDNVWAQLYPHIAPLGAKMTSAIRSPDDQVRIINNYWASSGAARSYPEIQDINTMVKVLTNMGYVINDPESTPHLSGKSFDVSGPNIESIAEKIKELSDSGKITAKLKVLIEPKNNAVHIDIIRASKNNKYLSKYAKEKEQIEHIYEDLCQSDVNPELLEEFKQVFRLDNHDLNKKAYVFTTDNNKPEVKIPEEQKQNDIGFGKDDQMGDWFEKQKQFIDRNSPDYNIDNVSESEAIKIANDEPEKFFYRGLHKQYPNLEIEAIKNIIKTNAKFYFIFKYNEREDAFGELLQEAAEALSQQDVRAFFYYYLHQKFPELGRGAIIQLIDTNPDSFFDLGLDKDYPDYIESANNARNIKDPNKVELEQPEWIKNNPGQPISIREKNAAVRPIPMTDEYTRSPSKNDHEEIIDKDKAIEMIEGKHPSDFLTHTRAIELYPDLKYRAIQNVAEKEPAVYFMNKIYKNPQFQEFNRIAILKLLDFKPHLYFTMGLFDTDEFRDFIDGAMFSLINKDPKFFLDVIIPNPQFKDFHYLKENAKNTIGKKASLSKRSGDVIELSGIPNYIIDDLKTLPGKTDLINYYTIENGAPRKTPIIDTIRGNIIVSEDPKVYIYWVLNSYKLEPLQPPDKHYKAAVHLILIDDSGKQTNEQMFIEFNSKLGPVVNKLKTTILDLQDNWNKVIEKKYPELPNNVIQLFSKEAAIQKFPKICNVCYKEYNTYEEFFNQPFRSEIRDIITLDDPGLQCQKEWGAPNIDFVYRDCNCGSTLVVKIPCLHNNKSQNIFLSKLAKRKKHSSAGVFIVVPKELAKQFPSLGEHDDSKPHITALYIGAVPKKHIGLLEETVKEVCSEQKPFKVKLDEKVSYFPATKHSDNCKIAKLKIISDDLHSFHRTLKKAISKAGIEIDDHFPTYKPHITLSYMPEGQEKYEEDFPHGSWLVESVEIWNGDNRKRFRLKGNLSKRDKK